MIFQWMDPLPGVYRSQHNLGYLKERDHTREEMWRMSVNMGIAKRRNEGYCDQKYTI